MAGCRSAMALAAASSSSARIGEPQRVGANLLEALDVVWRRDDRRDQPASFGGRSRIDELDAIRCRGDGFEVALQRRPIGQLAIRAHAMHRTRRSESEYVRRLGRRRRRQRNREKQDERLDTHRARIVHQGHRRHRRMRPGSPRATEGTNGLKSATQVSTASLGRKTKIVVVARFPRLAQGQSSTLAGRHFPIDETTAFAHPVPKLLNRFFSRKAMLAESIDDGRGLIEPRERMLRNADFKSSA